MSSSRVLFPGSDVSQLLTADSEEVGRLLTAIMFLSFLFTNVH